MNKVRILVLAALSAAALCAAAAEGCRRAPAWPLVTIDPYTSVWSATDTLYASDPVHWTDHPMHFMGVLTVDGKPYRFLGAEAAPAAIAAPHSEQAPWEGRYTLSAPGTGWERPGFDDSRWLPGAAPFGTSTLPHDTWVPAPGTVADSVVWVRRTFSLPTLAAGDRAVLDATFFDDAEIYVNGHKVVDSAGSGSGALHRAVEIPAAALNPGGENLLAARASHRSGAYGTLDLGVSVVSPAPGRYSATARQISAELRPTVTAYEFDCGPVRLSLDLMAPMLPDDLELLTRPVNYILYRWKSLDGRAHDVSILFEAGADWARNLPGQPMDASAVLADGLVFGKIGTVDQPVLEKWGDDLRIDWGWFYLGGPAARADVQVSPEAVSYTENLGHSTSGSGYALAAYDDVYSMIYFGQKLRPWWNRRGDSSILAQLRAASADLPAVEARCRRFDDDMLSKAAASGGRAYADLLALAFRQSLHAHKLLESPAGELLYLSKENFSNGSVGTVDLTYPSAPMFLLYNPDLLKGMMNPVFEYCASPEWGKPFAAHDVGRYPHANGQNYGGDMPVEESGNMLILAAAIADREGNADYARRHWPQLTEWAEYLYKYGLDPENQLCTDDFAGHLAHNANLSVKAILGMASYGKLAGMLGHEDTARLWLGRARDYAARWEKMADDGTHYRLAFDKPGSWSLKYNLVWDSLLGLNVFPAGVVDKEIASYAARGGEFGIPLDSREKYTKSDWIIWVAAMAPDRAGFDSFVVPLHRFMTTTGDRIPMTDWYWTDRPEAKHYTEHATDKAFRARSVVGAYFMKLLKDDMK